MLQLLNYYLNIVLKAQSIPHIGGVTKHKNTYK